MRMGLGRRTALFVFLASALTALAFFLMEYRQVADQLQKRMWEQARDQTALIARSLAPDLRFQRLYRIQTSLNDILQHERHDAFLPLRGFALVSPDGLTLAHSDIRRHPLMTPLMLPPAGMDNHELTVTTDIRHPTNGSLLGRLALSFDSSAIQARMASLQQRLWIALTVGLLLCLGMAWIVQRLISQPLLQLADLASLIGTGRMKTARLSSIPEIQRLHESLRQADERIVHAETEAARLAAMIHEASEAVVVTDPKGVIRYVNPAFERLSGYAADEAIGRTCALVKSGEHDERFYRKMWQTITAGRHWHSEFRNRRKDGAIYVVDQTIIPLLDGKGEIVAFASMQRDITELQEMEARLRQNDRLHALGVMAGGIAHDFNNLLSAIMGNAELARSKLPEHAPATEHLARILKASQSAADLCQQMLAYSGKGKFVIKQVNLSRLLEDMGDLIGVSVPKHVNIERRLSPNLPPVEADIGQMRQLALNLITNAAEAIGEQPGRITLATGVMHCDAAWLATGWGDDEAQPGDYVWLEVTDTGCGMTPDVIERIFDPFFTTKFTGRGLGMSALLGIVRGHHGRMHIDSRPGEGTTIRVAFPTHATTNIEDKNAPSNEANECFEGGVLLVDDEFDVREVAAAMLRDMGFDPVLEACDGEEALRVWRERGDDIHLIVLDLTMPVMDGKQCLEALHRMGVKTPVVLASGYGEEEIRRRFDDLPLAGVARKPFDMATFRAVIRRALEG